MKKQRPAVCAVPQSQILRRGRVLGLCAGLCAGSVAGAIAGAVRDDTRAAALESTHRGAEVDTLRASEAQREQRLLDLLSRLPRRLGDAPTR